MTTPDLTLITGVIATYLKGFSDLAPLTVSGVSAIVDVNAGDIQSLVQSAAARCGVCVAIMLASAVEDENQSITPFYKAVKVEIEVYENPTMNSTQGVGTGLAAWTIADRVYAALKLYRLTGLAAGDNYEVLPMPPGIVDVTSKDNVEAGIKVLRLHFQTKCQGVPRPS